MPVRSSPGAVAAIRSETAAQKLGEMIGEVRCGKPEWSRTVSREQRALVTDGTQTGCTDTSNGNPSLACPLKQSLSYGHVQFDFPVLLSTSLNVMRCLC